MTIETLLDEIEKDVRYWAKAKHASYEFVKDMTDTLNCISTLRAALPSVKVEAWQPIDTAPKDGTAILVPYSDWSGYKAVRWGAAVHEPHTEGWFEEDWSDEHGDEPKYWMPLPALPAAPEPHANEVNSTLCRKSDEVGE